MSTPPLEVLWKWAYLNLTPNKKDEEKNGGIEKAKIISELLAENPVQGDTQKAILASRVLLLRCLSYMFPDSPEVVDEFRDLSTDKVRALRKTTPEEKRERLQNLLVLPEAFRKCLLAEIRTELNQRPNMQRSGSSLNSSGTILRRTGSFSRVNSEDSDQENGNNKRKSIDLLTPPNSPPNKRPRITAQPSKIVRRSSSESALFSLNNSNPLPAIAIPSPINLAKLEQRLTHLEQRQIGIQQEIDDLRGQIHQFHHLYNPTTCTPPCNIEIPSSLHVTTATVVGATAGSANGLETLASHASDKESIKCVYPEGNAGVESAGAGLK